MMRYFLFAIVAYLHSFLAFAGDDCTSRAAQAFRVPLPVLQIAAPELELPRHVVAVVSKRVGEFPLDGCAPHLVAAFYLKSNYVQAVGWGRALNAYNPRLSRSRVWRVLLPHVDAAAARHGIPKPLLRALVHTESAYRIDAKSHAGAQGLGQLMPATARRFGVSDPFDPEQNLNAAAEYLAFLMRRYPGKPALAIAGYNAGEGAVDRYKGIPPYRETQTYVRRVIRLYSAYSKLPV